MQPTPADDDFHRPTTDDPWWNETAWFTMMELGRRGPPFAAV